MKHLTRTKLAILFTVIGLFLASRAEAKMAVIKRPVQNTLDVVNHLIITIRDDRTGVIISRDLLSLGGGQTQEGPNMVDLQAIDTFWSAYSAGTTTLPYTYAIIPKPPQASDDATFEQRTVSIFDGLYTCYYSGNYPAMGAGLNSNSIVDETLRKTGLEFKAILDLPQFSETPYQKAWRDVRSPDLRFVGCALAIGGVDSSSSTSGQVTPVVSEADPQSLMCDGADDSWQACRGSGCSVCSEQIAAYPLYLKNHPYCSRNDSCDWEFYQCSDNCPPPTDADVCNGSDGGWEGCRGSGCAVCAELVNSYPYYFVHHPFCIKNEACGGSHYACNSNCPPPSSRDTWN